MRQVNVLDLVEEMWFTLKILLRMNGEILIKQHMPNNKYRKTFQLQTVWTQIRSHTGAVLSRSTPFASFCYLESAGQGLKQSENGAFVDKWPRLHLKEIKKLDIV